MCSALSLDSPSAHAADGEAATALAHSGYYDVAPGKLATVVISLEMFCAPKPRAERLAAGWEFVFIEAPEVAWYRGLFRRIGEAYLWSSRLTLSDQALAAILADSRYEVFTFRSDARDEGLIELDFRQPDSCELTFFGLTSAFIGTGAGRWLMNRALARAWSKPIKRFWVHTCTLDHPAALAFYQRSGFRPFKQQVEIFDDPRTSGIYPASAARQVPRLS